MATPQVFKRRIDRRALKITKNATAAIRKVVLAIDSALVTGTPVDTGRARSNWLANINGPASGTVGAISGSAARSRTAGVVARVDAAKQEVVSVHLTNNLPYIGKLNDGSSKQAPAGFVRRAVLAGVSAVKSVKLLR